jgi:phenol 2-monooxygenase
MVHSPSHSPHHSRLQKMPPGQTIDANSHPSSGNTLDVAWQRSSARDDDYSSFISDVLVVGAGPAGLMLA